MQIGSQKGYLKRSIYNASWQHLILRKSTIWTYRIFIVVNLVSEKVKKFGSETNESLKAVIFEPHFVPDKT